MNEFITCLKKYATFQGRARRKEYWFLMLFAFFLCFGGGVLDLAVYDGKKEFFSDLVSLALFLPGLAALVRRMHDVNANGWLVLIPLLNLILACTPGTSGRNRFGDDPKSCTISS
jgi:uncharacterized membrane protein YhaH (DUF805 family)